MDIKSLNSQIQTVKNIVKAIPPDMLGQYKPIINDFYNIVTKMEENSRSSMDQINRIKENMRSDITTNANLISNIINKISEINEASSSQNIDTNVNENYNNGSGNRDNNDRNSTRGGSRPILPDTNTNNINRKQTAKVNVRNNQKKLDNNMSDGNNTQNPSPVPGFMNNISTLGTVLGAVAPGVAALKALTGSS